MERRLANNWREIHLTEHFKLGEFAVSRSHPEIASRLVPDIPMVEKATMLAYFALEPIRVYYRQPVIITSGFRNMELNEALLGDSDSQHLYGEAVDFEILGMDMEDVYKWCKSALHWKGELIYYLNRHVHIALPSIFAKADQYIKTEV